MVTKAHILAEIRRTARANGGIALGRQRFRAETGIKETDWSGKYWARWGDAVAEAGFSPNRLQTALHESLLLEKLAALVRELGHFPVASELKLKRRDDPTFPSHNTFNRFGGRSALMANLAEFCTRTAAYADVAQICRLSSPGSATTRVAVAVEPEHESEEAFGFVYLLKSGRYYKIGRSNAVGRREREIALQLPERAAVAHSIKTDDPPGIEAYWHQRFASRRKNGEWFELTAQDVRAFTRRKLM